MIEQTFIAACSPANMTAILAHVEAQTTEIERLHQLMNDFFTDRRPDHHGPIEE